MLLLDEPSNDLDIPTLTILEDYLNSFEGIVIAVSHDRYFLDNVVDRIFAFEGEAGKLKQYEGGYTDYRQASSASGEKEPAGRGAVSEEKKKAKDRKGSRPVKPRFSYREQKEYETIDEEITALEERLAEIGREMEACACEYGRLSELTAEKETVGRALEEKMERWVYLNELAEKVAAGKG